MILLTGFINVCDIALYQAWGTRINHKAISYLAFPKLNLPTTTNSVESMNKIIRSHCRHLRTPDSLILRSTCLIRMRKTIACKPKIFQQN